MRFWVSLLHATKEVSKWCKKGKDFLHLNGGVSTYYCWPFMQKYTVSARLLSFDVEGGGGVASLAMANALGGIHKLGWLHEVGR